MFSTEKIRVCLQYHLHFFTNWYFYYTIVDLILTQRSFNPHKISLRSLGSWGFFLIILLIIKGSSCLMLKQTIWPSNYTSHTKVYFNEFVANVVHDDIGIVIFDLRGHGGCKRPKTSLRGQKYHEGVDLLKKVFDESFSATSKIP